MISSRLTKKAFQICVIAISSSTMSLWAPPKLTSFAPPTNIRIPAEQLNLTFRILRDLLRESPQNGSYSPILLRDIVNICYILFFNSDDSLVPESNITRAMQAYEKLERKQEHGFITTVLNECLKKIGRADVSIKKFENDPEWEKGCNTAIEYMEKHQDALKLRKCIIHTADIEYTRELKNRIRRKTRGNR